MFLVKEGFQILTLKIYHPLKIQRILKKLKTNLFSIGAIEVRDKRIPKLRKKTKTRDRIYIILAYMCAENGSIIKDAALEECKNDQWINKHTNSFPIPFILKPLNNDRALKDMF